MSALTRRGSRGLFLDLFELLDPLDMLHLWLGGLAMRIEDGIQNGRYMVCAEMHSDQAGSTSSQPDVLIPRNA